VQLLGPLHLRPHELELRLRAGHLRLQHGAGVARAPERGLAGDGGGLRARQRLLGRGQVRLALIDGELELAAVVVGQDRAGLHPVAQVDAQARDRAGLLGLRLDLVGGQDAAASLHRALHGTRLGGRHRDDDGTHGDRAIGRSGGGAGGLGLAAIAGSRRRQSREQEHGQPDRDRNVQGPQA
jgi:hypothetical protein